MQNVVQKNVTQFVVQWTDSENTMHTVYERRMSDAMRTRRKAINAGYTVSMHKRVIEYPKPDCWLSPI